MNRAIALSIAAAFVLVAWTPTAAAGHQDHCGEPETVSQGSDGPVKTFGPEEQGCAGVLVEAGSGGGSLTCANQHEVVPGFVHVLDGRGCTTGVVVFCERPLNCP